MTTVPGGVAPARPNPSTTAPTDEPAPTRLPAATPLRLQSYRSREASAEAVLLLDLIPGPPPPTDGLALACLEPPRRAASEALDPERHPPKLSSHSSISVNHRPRPTNPLPLILTRVAFAEAVLPPLLSPTEAPSRRLADDPPRCLRSPPSFIRCLRTEIVSCRLADELRRATSESLNRLSPPSKLSICRFSLPPKPPKALFSRRPNAPPPKPSIVLPTFLFTLKI
ncbi:hypothetical protein BT93_E2442 [Corymbia citriodora subsp. variegata]|nr:hypothetical protein BT93_E2442 [Corymbia citriodora subsp. variegata]